MDINEVQIKFSSKVAIPPRTLELGQDVEFKVKGTVVKEEHLDTQEGKMNVTYVVKVVEVE